MFSYLCVTEGFFSPILMCIEALLKEKKWKDDDVSFCYVFINSELTKKKKTCCN